MTIFYILALIIGSVLVLIKQRWTEEEATIGHRGFYGGYRGYLTDEYRDHDNYRYHDDCARSSCACTSSCACACAGSGRAGCSKKRFLWYKFNN